MEKEELTPEQGFQIIQQMIESAKKEISDNGFFYLLWGYLVFTAALGHYVMLKMELSYAFITWPVLMPLGGIISIIQGIVSGKKNKRKTRSWVDHIFVYTWISFGVSLFIVLFMGGKLGWEVVYPMVILLYGIGTFISGGIMKFRPLILGGIICWVLALIAFYVSFEHQLILIIIAILSAYIIPGHILKNKAAQHV